MTWAVSCGECSEVVWPPFEAEGSGGRSEIAALRLALEHATEAGHREVDVIPGCHYVGDGQRPETFGSGVTVEDCVTPTRGKMTDDLAFAVDTLRSQADRFERWADSGDDEAEASIVARNLRERADLLERKQREREERGAEA